MKANHSNSLIHLLFSKQFNFLFPNKAGIVPHNGLEIILFQE